MDTEGGVEEPRVRLGAIEEALEREPFSFEFFQAVRLLQQLRPDRGRVGRFGNPDDEAVHFGATPSTAFSPVATCAASPLEDSL